MLMGNRSMPDLKSIVLLALLSLAGTAFPQSLPAVSTFRLDADFARFIGGDSLSYVQVYYGISEGSLTYRKGPGGYIGGISMRISVADSASTVASREWVLPRTLDDTAALRAPKNILSFESLALPGGQYRVTLSASDSLDPGRADSAVIPIRIVTPARRAALSDIVLCSRITPAAERSSPFYKNTLEVIPNPSRLFGEGLPVLRFYVEVYNLNADPGPAALLRASILDSRGREVAFQAKTKPRSSSSSVEYGAMNIGSLPGGSYLFRIALMDTTTEPARALATSEKKFFVYNPKLAPADGAPPRVQAFTVMTETEADDEIRKVRYIMSEPERKQIERLPDLNTKRNFLQEFWSGRIGTAPAGSLNARDAYLTRVREADAKYSERSREGWLTDRGRVSILYGPPDNVDRHPSQPECRPYETWEYNSIQGGVVFVFVDKLGFGSYRLVHSTHLDEMRNDDWYKQEAEIR
jgi:GWxTD domain-containing protein